MNSAAAAAAASSFYRNLEMLEDEPLYVNAKQYHRILKRRDARTRFEAQIAKLKKTKVWRVVFFSLFRSHTCTNRAISMPCGGHGARVVVF